MSIQYRERTKPFDVYNADYTQMNDYHHSFNTMPRTSQLRLAISPGQHKFNNLDFNDLLIKNPNFIPLENAIFLAYDPRIRYLNGLQHVKQQNDYIKYQTNNKIPIQYKSCY